jgi:endonuclease/exonuclease/phosphatase family metal-dependent hydrolase
MELTIATWNIAGAHTVRSNASLDYNPEDIGYFVEQLRSISADVICLQETHINTQRSVAQEIAKSLGEYSCIEQDNSPSHVDPEYRLGNAILTKCKILNEEQFVLPYPDFPLARLDGKQTVRHDKGVQLVGLDFGTVVNLQMLPLRFLGTPYDTPLGRDFARKMEIQLIEKKSPPLIICGDINYDNAIGLYPELLDGMTSVLPEVPTRPDNKRTDYIFCTKEFSVLESGVIGTNSDHYLCWARLGI